MVITDAEKKLKQFDFNELLRPYKECGTEENPIERNMGLIVFWLTVKKRLPIDIVGGAIFTVFMKILEEGDFKGNAAYGSAGNELDQAIIQVAQDMYNEKTMTGMYKKLASGRYPEMKRYIMGAQFEAQAWCFKMWSVKYWKFRALKRAEKKKEIELKKEVQRILKKKELDRLKNAA